jgi:hypothetical protein
LLFADHLQHRRPLRQQRHVELDAQARIDRAAPAPAGAGAAGFQDRIAEVGSVGIGMDQAGRAEAGQAPVAGQDIGRRGGATGQRQEDGACKVKAWRGIDTNGGHRETISAPSAWRVTGKIRSWQGWSRTTCGAQFQK